MIGPYHLIGCVLTRHLPDSGDTQVQHRVLWRISITGKHLQKMRSVQVRESQSLSLRRYERIADLSHESTGHHMRGFYHMIGSLIT